CVTGYRLCPDGKCYLNGLSCPANAASLNLSLVYERVVTNPIASRRTKLAKIVILGKEGANAGGRWAFSDVPTVYDAAVGGGTYNAVIDISGVTTSAAGSRFDIITIGPQHLKKRTDNVTLITGTNPATGKTGFGLQRAGDINNPAQDNQVNTLDWEIMRWHFQNINDEAGIIAADLNFDGQVNTLDWDIMRTNFQANGNGE
ncbi:MAG: dockerin type I domain-containing protein, partial [bacterium]|nr:dockerin type I domain-containing protein [bacterium]